MEMESRFAASLFCQYILYCHFHVISIFLWDRCLCHIALDYNFHCWRLYLNKADRNFFRGELVLVFLYLSKL